MLISKKIVYPILFSIVFISIPWTYLIPNQIFISDQFSLFEKFSSMQLDSDILFQERSIYGYLQGETLGKLIIVQAIKLVGYLMLLSMIYSKRQNRTIFSSK